jgi:hypothetical protein
MVLKFLFYKRPTLFLLFPLELLFDLGLFFVYLKNGWPKEFFDARFYWLSKKNRDIWKKYRVVNMKERVISDRELISSSKAAISSASVGLPPVMKSLVNTVFTIYYYLLKILVWW